MVKVTADATPQEPQNLRNTRRQARATRREMGAETEATVKPIEEKPYTAVSRNGPTPEKPSYTRDGYKAKEGQQLWEATGSSGQIAVRSSAQEMVCGIDVADVAATRELARLGQVWEMFPSQERAEKRAERLRAMGLTVNIVPVRPYAGQPNDPA